MCEKNDKYTNVHTMEELITQVKNDPETISNINIQELLNKNIGCSRLEGKTLSSVNNEIFEAVYNIECSPPIPIEKKRIICERLAGFIFVSQVNQIKNGRISKIISIKTGKVMLVGTITGVKFGDKGTQVQCIFFGKSGKHIFYYNFDNYLTFQQCSDDEQMILWLSEEALKSK